MQVDLLLRFIPFGHVLNNIRYAGETTLMSDTEKNNAGRQVNKESQKYGLNLNFEKEKKKEKKRENLAVRKK